MTIEERLRNVERTDQYHEARIGLLESIAERQHSLLEEIKEETAMTRRLWVHLARKNGWLEDEDWPPPQQ